MNNYFWEGFEKEGNWRAALAMLLTPTSVHAADIKDLIHQTAAKYEIQPKILEGLVFTESSFRPSVVNLSDGNTIHTQSVGLAQVKPSTAKMLGFKGTPEQLKNPIINIEYGAKYLKKQLNRYGGDYRKALSAYNAGTFTTKNRDYVKKILKYAK